MKPLTLSISAVERDTGLSKDSLRIWERRYGFPSPLRDAFGERAYPIEQVEKLRTLKRLMDAGHRPGRIVGLPAEALGLLTTNIPQIVGAHTSALPAPELAPFLALLHAHDVDGLRRLLAQAQVRLGIARWVTDVISPLNTRVGEAWMRGQLQIYEEHSYTEVVQGLLRHAIYGIPESTPSDHPQVLLTTFPGEPHGLGLLMAEALLAIDGARCLALGVQTPLWDIVLAAQAHRCDVVALSFTGCTVPNQVVESLSELRAKLPAAVEIWAGGAASVLHRRPVAGVTAMARLEQIPLELQRWRADRPKASASERESAT